ncbi:protein rep [Dietzia sp. NPDC055877]
MSSALVIGQDRDRAGAVDGDWVRPRRVARCSWRVGTDVGVHVGPSGAHFSGIERCGSVWSCPVCSAVIRADRAKEIETGVVAHLENGGGALFLTGTIRHTRDDSLHVGLEAILSGWRKVINGTPWKRWAKRIGLVGIIRTVEITRSHRNGWHPHLHALALLEAPISDEMRAAFQSWVLERWRTMVTKLGARLPSVERGFTVRNVGKDGRVLAQYLTKVQEEKRVQLGAEIARADLKSGRSGSRLPFQLLDTAGHNDDDKALWLEYVDATAGRRCFTWSKGLRTILGEGADRANDDEMPEAEKAPLLGVIDAETYDMLRKTPQITELMDQLEAAAAGGEAGYLLALVTPKRDTAYAPLEHSPERPLPEVAPRHPVLGPVLIGSRDLLDLDKHRERAAAEVVAPVVALDQFDWDGFEAAQRRELAAIHEKIGVKES